MDERSKNALPLIVICTGIAVILAAVSINLRSTSVRSEKGKIESQESANLIKANVSNVEKFRGRIRGGGDGNESTRYTGPDSNEDRPQPLIAQDSTFEGLIKDLEALPAGLNSRKQFNDLVAKLRDADYTRTVEYFLRTEAYPENWRAPRLANLIRNWQDEGRGSDLPALILGSESGLRLVEEHPYLFAELMGLADEPGFRYSRKELLDEVPEASREALMESESVLTTIFEEDPGKALEYSLRYATTNDDWDSLGRLARVSARNDPEMFASLIEANVGPETGKDDPFYSIAEAFSYDWARRELNSALNWIDQQPWPLRDQMIANVWREIAGWDESAAKKWIGSIRDDNRRRNLLDKFDTRKQ